MRTSQLLLLLLIQTRFFLVSTPTIKDALDRRVSETAGLLFLLTVLAHLGLIVEEARSAPRFAEETHGRVKILCPFILLSVLDPIGMEVLGRDAFDQLGETILKKEMSLGSRGGGKEGINCFATEIEEQHIKERSWGWGTLGVPEWTSST